MTRWVVFCGPSLPAAAVARFMPRAEVRPPASCGDVYRAAARGAVALGLIDGSNDHRLSVWHKEILWALERGVHVYGAAGLGAIRAAELHPFGMVGVGRIFGWYRDGALESDDEVAIAHASAEHGYRAQSEALVNMRATLERAVAKWIVSDTQAQALLEIARRLFYPVRNYRTLVEGAEAEGVLQPEALARLIDWLASASESRVDQKRIDAEALVRRMAAARHEQRADPPSFSLHATEAWHRITQRLAREDEGEPPRALPEPS